MLKTTTSVINASQITGVLPVVNGGTGVTTSTGTGSTVLSTTPSFTGDVTLSTGNLVIGTSGKGIDFSATPGTGTSELLDDYEEGTWTPVFIDITGSPTGTARYVKVGRQVTLTYEQSGGTFTCTAGAGIITGIPFLGIGGSGVVSACGAISNTVVTSVLALYNASTTGHMYVTAAFVSAGGVGFSITYFV